MSPSADRARRAAAAPRRTGGFSLVELLVALAIFIVIMGSLAALLSGAVDTARQGYALMNAMERARGSMSVLEADLKTAFATPQNRQNFQFYGEPNGFLYSGQLSSGGFGRVTYAVHEDNAQPAGMQGQPTGAGAPPDEVTLLIPWGDVARQFARVLLDRNPSKGGLPNIDKNGDGAPDISIQGYPAAATAISDTDYALYQTSQTGWFDAYSAHVFQTVYGVMPADFNEPVEFTLRIRRGVLLRYEERGQGTMTQFSSPVMTQLFARATTEQPSPLDPENIYSLVHPLGSAEDETSVLASFPDATREQLDRLQQAHYWVRMLSGSIPLNGMVDPFVANTNGAGPMPPFWSEDGNASGPSWRNYVVTEGILVAAELVRPGTDQVIRGIDHTQLDDAGNPGRAVPVNALDISSFFFYGLEDGANSPTFNTLWDMPRVTLAGNPGVSRPMFGYFLFGGDAAPLSKFYMNTGAADLFAEALRTQVYDYSPGDPLKPRLPAWVAPGFWIFGDPSRTGAAPFHQWFQQKVDIPSAYLRPETGA